MATKHTPGPWEAVKDSRGDTWAIFGPGKMDFVGHVMDLMPPADNEANARLMAAAPDLLAACESLINAPHQEHFAVRLNDEEMAAVELIKSAILKAKGETK